MITSASHQLGIESERKRPSGAKSPSREKPDAWPSRVRTGHMYPGRQVIKKVGFTWLLANVGELPEWRRLKGSLTMRW